MKVVVRDVTIVVHRGDEAALLVHLPLSLPAPEQVVDEVEVALPVGGAEEAVDDEVGPGVADAQPAHYLFKNLLLFNFKKLRVFKKKFCRQT